MGDSNKARLPHPKFCSPDPLIVDTRDMNPGTLRLKEPTKSSSEVPIGSEAPHKDSAGADQFDISLDSCPEIPLPSYICLVPEPLYLGSIQSLDADGCTEPSDDSVVVEVEPFLATEVPSQSITLPFNSIESSLGGVWQDALFSKHAEQAISFATTDGDKSSEVSCTDNQEDGNTTTNCKTCCKNDHPDPSLSIEIHDLLGNLAVSPLSAEEEPDISLDTSQEQASRDLPSPNDVLQTDGGLQCDNQVQPGSGDEPTSVQGSSSAKPHADISKGRLKIPSTPQHTPDRPNWALAPDEPPRPLTSSVKNTSTTEPRHGGRHRGRSKEDLRKKTKSTSLVVSSPDGPLTSSRKPSLTPSGQSRILDFAKMSSSVTENRSALQGAAQDPRISNARKRPSNQTIDSKKKDAYSMSLDDYVLAGSLQSRRALDSFPASVIYQIQNTRPAEVPSSRREVNGSSEMFSKGPSFSNQSLSSPVGTNPSAPHHRHTVQGCADSVSNTERVLERIPRPSLEDEMRFHAAQRALLLASKSSTSPQGSQLISESDPNASTSTESGNFVPFSKPCHSDTCFDESAGGKAVVLPRVHLPAKKPGTSCSQPVNFGLARGRRVQGVVSDHHGNTIDTLPLDTFPWEGTQFPSPAGQNIVAPVSTNPSFPGKRRPLPPRPQTAHNTSYKHLHQHDKETINEMTDVYVPIRRIPGSAEHRRDSYLSSSASSSIGVASNKPSAIVSLNDTRLATTPNDHLHPLNFHVAPFVWPDQQSRYLQGQFHTNNGIPGTSIFLENPGESGWLSLSEVQNESDSTRHSRT